MARLVWAASASVILLLLTGVGIYVTNERSSTAQASWSQVSTIVGVDTNTSGNDATHVGNIDRCVSVPNDPNQTFNIDLFVKDVTDLNKWEGTLRFDGTKLEVSSIDVQYFLGTGSNIYNGSDTTPNSSGSFVAGALDKAHVPESGSGVLARVTMRPLETATDGASSLYFALWWPFGVSGIILEDEEGLPIGDVEGTAPYNFDGMVFNAMVVIGNDPCPTDADLDGFTNVEESVDGSDLLDAGSTPEVCDGVNNDLDGIPLNPQTDEWYDRDPANGVPDCGDSASDTDGDQTYNPTDTDDDNDSAGGTRDPGAAADTCPAGVLPLWADCVEAYLGTDTLADCAQTLYHSAWPLDINNDRAISASYDLVPYRGGLIGSLYGDGKFRKRLDLNTDGAISAAGDLLQFRGRLGQTCS